MYNNAKELHKHDISELQKKPYFWVTKLKHTSELPKQYTILRLASCYKWSEISLHNPWRNITKHP